MVGRELGGLTIKMVAEVMKQLNQMEEIAAPVNLLLVTIKEKGRSYEQCGRNNFSEASLV